MTKEEEIHVALFDKIRIITGLAILERNRDTPVDAFPAVVYRDAPAEPDYSVEVEQTYWRMQPEIELFVDADEPRELSGKMATLYQKVVTPLLQDHTLGGLTEDIRLVAGDSDLLAGEGKRPTMGRVIRLQVEFETASAASV